ncbi:endolytic transglycosylase MltG [Candidatus Enterococcus dunnyi]|uniref:endolytic transglycosylase MltG n=1 Tax=Enterococcus TaxID=1350 RepID=UPI003BAF3800
MDQSKSTDSAQSQDEKSKKRTRKKEDRIVGRIVLIVASVLLLVIAIFGFTFYKYVTTGLEPLNKKDSKLVQVHIPEDSSNKKIANILEESKVIKSGMVFNYYAKFKNLTDFQAGYYQMSPDMTLDEIGALLREGGTAEPTQLADGKVTIPEGFDIDKIGDAIEKNTDFKKDQFIELMKKQEFFDAMNQKYPELLGSAGEAADVRYRLEGYLFPATYDYYKDSKIEDFVEQMIAKTNSVMEGYLPMVHAKGMTIQQVLTLASLVEKEGVKEDDRKKIAQVFFNRISANMPLQSDISILYALGEHKELVTYQDLEVDSPYNLYKNTGYGPGPLDSPSEQAINAVLNPTPNNYLYFVADISTGNVYFAETYEEHQEYVEKYVNNTDTEKSE